jgi:hypothetical protein
MPSWRIACSGAVLALALLLACASTTTSADCAEEPELECSACAGSPPNVAICEEGQWACPASGPCTAPPEEASTPPDASSDAGVEAGRPCRTDADCDGGTRCGFLESDLCSATGVCVSPLGCQGPENFCACGGGATVCIAAGYASAPINGKIGPCADDAGAPVDGASDAASE